MELTKTCNSTMLSGSNGRALHTESIYSVSYKWRKSHKGFELHSYPSLFTHSLPIFQLIRIDFHSVWKWHSICRHSWVTLIENSLCSRCLSNQRFGHQLSSDWSHSLMRRHFSRNKTHYSILNAIFDNLCKHLTNNFDSNNWIIIMRFKFKIHINCVTN